MHFTMHLLDLIVYAHLINHPSHSLLHSLTIYARARVNLIQHHLNAIICHLYLTKYAH
jgi:hypothetical protein